MNIVIDDSLGYVIEIGGADPSRFEVTGYTVIRDYKGPVPQYTEFWELGWDGSQLIIRSESDLLPFEKDQRKTEIRNEAYRIVTAKWPLWRQSNANAGIYPQSTKDEMDSDIASVIQASNDAEDAVDAATTVDEVEAVTPNWPTI